MTDAITLVLRSTDEARNRFRIGALRYAASILRRLDEHRAADKLIVRIRQLAATELRPIAGCGSEFHTCSLCVGVVGCATGATCPP